MRTHYFNTTETVHPELDKYENKAKSQEERILEFMKTNQDQGHGVWLPPSAALKFIFDNAIPLTSVRRALTNLTNEGKLIKTDIQHKGPYGRPEFLWRLADKYAQREMF